MCRRAVVFTAMLLGAAAWSAAQPPLRPEVLQEQSVRRPGFTIEPLVHEVDTRPGQSVRVNFRLSSLDRARTILVKPVGLRQQASGLILPEGEPSKHLRIVGEPVREVKAGQQEELTVEIDVPHRSGAFQAYGLLVTETAPPQTAPVRVPLRRASLGVQFQTRYLLRIELRVAGGRGGDPRQIELKDGQLRAIDGKPHAVWFVNNPTQSAHEFQVRCQLLSDRNQRIGRPFLLSLPVRAKAVGQQRHACRALAETQVQVMSELPEAIYRGEYRLQAELISSGRVLVRETADVQFDERQFSAQAQHVAWVTPSLRVQPTQVELSLQRGGRRLAPVTFHNNGKKPVAVRLAALNRDGRVCSWLVLRPETFELPAGSTRNVAVSFRDVQPRDPHQYAALRVSAAADGETPTSRDLIVGLTTQADATTSINAEPARLYVQGNEAYFFTHVANHGERHVVPSGELEVTSPEGQVLRLKSPAGGWVLPGRRVVVRFPLEKVVPGIYQTELRLIAAEGESPQRVRSRVLVRDEDIGSN